VNIFANLKDNGFWIQATKKSFDELDIPKTVCKVGICDAFGISLRIFGRTITNSTILGSFARTTELVSLESLCKGMESVAFRDADLDKNIEALHRGFDETQVFEIKKGER
jgi:Pyruvate/2-oxoacid:ferredoxin oxidoreductase gamma subunit